MEPTFRQPSSVPMDEGTHSGEDVGVFVSGPYSHVKFYQIWIISTDLKFWISQLFTGVYEQNFIAHAVMYAACLGPNDLMKNSKCKK